MGLPICGYGLYLPRVLRNHPASVPIFSDNFNDGDLAGWAPNGGAREDTAAMEPLFRGGTGSRSEFKIQPEDWPDKFESGTPNGVGIAGLGARVRYVLARDEDAAAALRRDPGRQERGVQAGRLPRDAGWPDA